MRSPDRRRLITLAAATTALALSIGPLQPPAGAATPAEAIAIVTIVEGDAVLMRDRERLRPVEGTRLLSQDVIETAPNARGVLRIEYPDGMAINLGPATRLLIDPQFYGERGRFARVYLLAGWCKLKGPATPGAADQRPIPLLASPAIDLFNVAGSVVLQVDEPAFSLFVESGAATVHERLAARPVDDPKPLRVGQFLRRSATAASILAPRPAAEFIDSMPRAFLDTLPDRAALFRERTPVPKPLGPISYADVAHWLAVEWTLRRPAMKRWQALTQDAGFRAALVANMKAHPEWDRVLFPDRHGSGR